MGEAVGAGAEGLQAILIQLKEHDVQVLDAALHGHLLAEQGQIADALLAQIDVQPHHVVGPHGLFHLLKGEALHVGVAGHHFQHALGLAEQGGHVLAAADESAGHMLALGGQLLAGIIGGSVILIPEHLRGLVDGELIKVALVLHHGLAQIGQQRGTDKPLGRRGRRGQGQNAVGALQHGVDIQLVHPGIGEDLLHAAAEGQILLDLPLQILVQLVDSAVEGGGDGRGLKVLVAVHAGHFLHDVGLDADVAGGAPRRHHHVHIVAVEGHLIAQQLHLLLHVVGGQGLAQAAFQPAQGHVDLRLLQGDGICIHKTSDLHLGIKVAEELHR